MSKVGSRLRVTIPKAVAERHGLRPGDEIEWIFAVDSIRIVPMGRTKARALSLSERLRLFDEATERQRLRLRDWRGKPPNDRGWTRAELYERGRRR